MSFAPPPYYRLITIVSAVALACSPNPPRPPPAPPRAAAAAMDDRPVVLFVGTSLTAGFGVGADQAFPARIQELLDSAGLGFRVVNAGVSGETSAGALSRVDWLFERQRAAVLVLETGANDGLRGQDPDTLRAHLAAIFARAGRQDPPPRLVLLAMEALPNLGATYAAAFRAVYPEAARRANATLVPFFLDGVAGVDSLNQADGIHPTARGHALAARRVWSVLEPLLREVAAEGERGEATGPPSR